ncbi:beta-ketoacyl synthase domain-containing protein [Penicillium canescens]|nr:beta-ketoacyl synthase domain-containing protein [Penicillium canescens]
MTIDNPNREVPYKTVGHDEPLAPPYNARKAYLQEPVAIVGMACRLPGESNTPKALWNFLMKGGVAKNTPPESRFNIAGHHDGSKMPKTMRSPGGMFLENIDPQEFDASFFDYEHMQSRDPEDRAPTVTVGVGRAILSNRISHFLNIKGPSMTVDTACSGSLVSVDLACRYLTTGEIDGAIVAGANMYLSPEHNMDSGAMKGASSLSGKCHTFDEKADGYIKAEGVNAVMLKRLSDAIRDGNPIRAVIRGSATNSDGHTAGIASPSAEAQSMAIRAAYANAGLSNFHHTSYIECHGTGTQAGDPTEVSGVSSVFTPGRDSARPLYIGSIKSNIGHSEPAAGISGLIKAVLAIENAMIPGNPTFINPNPKIDFIGLNVQASRIAREWPDMPFRRASVNSFGYGGSNAHVVVEETGSFTNIKHVSSYQTKADNMFDEDDNTLAIRPFLIPLSANDDQSLMSYFDRLRTHLMDLNVKVEMASLAHTLSDCRSKLYHRGYIVTQSTNLDETAFVHGKKTAEPPRIGFIFTGQGAQWPQMGKDLVETFPSARLLLRQLDLALQSLPDPPAWSLLDELTQPRSAETLRQPEFSQPLVTALQLVIVEILQNWGVCPQSVVGHSSGEIAAACVAGLISKETAIIAAFYRGYAATRAPQQDLGMLAAGISAAEFPNYTSGIKDAVSIACFNSPQSITVSGTIPALELLRLNLVRDNKFARLLQVNLAYHSKYMKDIGDDYDTLLSAQVEAQSPGNKGIRMFSSVTGSLLEGPVFVDYWKANMTSPVCFDRAVQEMLSVDSSPDFLIEIGPSGALAGPISQIVKALPNKAASVQYTAALSRGRDAIKATFDVAGKLFIAGGTVNLSNVNQLGGEGEVAPAVIVDLPNYAWNYSTKYWYENEASKDWRYRLFPHHVLLGSKILGSSWNEPAFKKTLEVDSLPWLRDHRMGPDIVFPAAGFVSMAIEAIRQKTEALNILDGKPGPKVPSYRLRNLTFNRALVLEERKPCKVMLTLTPRSGSGTAWHDYKVSSLVDGVWRENSAGLIQVTNQVERVASAHDIRNLEYPADGRLWYKAMNDIGYNFGPAFQKQLQVECTSGERNSRSIVSLEEPDTSSLPSAFALHPACIDGCFQTCAPSLWNGNRSDVNAVLIPAIIDDIIVNQRPEISKTGIAVSSSAYVGLGRPDETKSYLSNSSVYVKETGQLLFQVSGLRYHKLDVREEIYSRHAYSQVVWNRDITSLSDFTDISTLLGIDNGDEPLTDVHHIVDMASHKKPHLSVAEINVRSNDPTSIWLDGSLSDSSSRRSAQNIQVMFADPGALLDAQETYSSHENAHFVLTDIASEGYIPNGQTTFDLVVLKLSGSDEHYRQIVDNTRKLLADGGCLLVVDYDGNDEHTTTRKGQTATSVDTNGNDILHGNGGTSDSNSDGFEILDSTERPRAQRHSLMDRKDLTCLGARFYPSIDSNIGSIVLGRHETIRKPVSGSVSLLQFSKPVIASLKLQASLVAAGWNVSQHEAPFDDIDPESIGIVVEFGDSILPTITEPNWEALKAIISSGMKLLWVTEGSQMEVTNPSKAMIHGLGRTVRAEDPSVNLTTLDVEGVSNTATFNALVTVLKRIQSPRAKDHIESEYVERGGYLHVPRILPDNVINKAEAEVVDGRPPILQSLHSAETTIRLQCERVGTIDTIQYNEVAPTELPLGENLVEVELFAAGLNFKDVAITMGIVPENEHLLGLEGAGLIRRVHPSVTKFKPGERVLVFKKGAFANRVIATVERTYHIPDWMSYEEASTLASVYLTAMYSIKDLANTQKGHRVLIHSATGGLGQASIQICHNIGAEIYATVGNDEKRKFLVDRYGIPEDRIFSSRSTDFASELMHATHGAGVDVILNSLTGELMEESWRCIAAGGTMVELGKKDMLDRNYLSMEPFGRNASYRCFDMSHAHVSDTLIARLLDQTMDLIKKRQLTPIGPITTFSFADIPSAFRYMRGGKHIGKIVISDGPNTDVQVAARPAQKALVLKGDVSYLIVGGLKGLCGTVATQLARHGAKHLVILSRSGCDDERSQAVLKNLKAIGCSFTLVTGDVAKKADVTRCFKEAPLPIGGIIQGAMVLRDRVFTSMTISEYYQAIEPKLQGSWNLHDVSIETGSTINFFTMLSSISGVVGQKGQANYAAANVFLDNFARYRRKQGLKACSVDLGAIDDIGYMSEHKDLLVALDTAAWTPINESLFNKILRVAILQDIAPLNAHSNGQLITSIAVPQEENSRLLADARFAGLCFRDQTSGSGGSAAADETKELQALLLLLKNGAPQAALMGAAIEAVNKQFMVTLRLSAPMEPGKPLSSYGMDSLAAVEFRNWARLELQVELTTLEIANANSLHALCDKIVSNMNKS